MGLGLKGINTSKKYHGERRGKKRKEREGDEEKKKKKKENYGFSTFRFEWSLSFEGGFPKVLKDV